MLNKKWAVSSPPFPTGDSNMLRAFMNLINAKLALLETRIPFIQTTSSSLPRNGSFVIQDTGMLFRELRDALPDLEGLHLKKRAQDEETEYLLEGLVVCKKKHKKQKTVSRSESKDEKTRCSSLSS